VKIRDALRLLAVIRRLRKEIRMPMLPDKPAAQSATIWGNAIKALGLVVVAVGAAVGGETTWVGVLESLPTLVGAVLAVVGMFVGKVGERRAQGEVIKALKNP
jgi:hypothetical protein